MVCAAVNSFSWPSHTAALQSYTIFSSIPCGVEEELRKGSTAEVGCPSASKAEDKRKSLNSACRKVQREEQEVKKRGLHCTVSEGFRFDAVQDEESLIALKRGEDKEEEPTSSKGKPFVSHTDTHANPTLAGFLKACADRKDLERGRRIHFDIVRKGSLEKKVFLGSSLINLYAKCGALEQALVVFNELPIHSIVAWNALIGGYVQYDHGKDALDCYDRMELQGFPPDNVTFLYILKVCGSTEKPIKGQYVHSQTIKAGLSEDARIGTALVGMYFKCGLLVEAQKVFDRLTSRDAVAWTALILGYAQHECGEEALKCFEQMQTEGLRPDALTFACVLKACGSYGIAFEGQRIHAELVRDELLEKDMVAGSALLDMYASCGMLAEAQEVFGKLPVKNVVSWSALMEGYAQLGKDKIVFSLFDKMIVEGTKPSWVTFTILLNACCHRGLIDNATTYFKLMSKGCNIIPTIEHHTCMVDLLCRAGQFDKAIAIIEGIPICANSTMWHAILDACQRCGNIKIGRWAFKCVIELNRKDAGAYVCLSKFGGSQRQAWSRRKAEEAIYETNNARVGKDWT